MELVDTVPGFTRRRRAMPRLLPRCCSGATGVQQARPTPASSPGGCPEQAPLLLGPPVTASSL